MTSKQGRSVRKQQTGGAARLGRNLEKNLLAYAAAAAGAGLLATTMPAEAEIIYTSCNTPLTLAGINRGQAVTILDLTNTGHADFGFVMSATRRYSSYSSYPTRFKYFLKVVPAAGNAVVQGKQAPTASAVPAGVKIGTQEKFGTGGKYLEIESYVRGNGIRSSGTWQQVEYAYVGLKFLIDGQVHYGWARVKFPFPGGAGFDPTVYYGSIYGYAYESIPNQPIVTGHTGKNSQQCTSANEPARLGLLAAGASGVDVWRPKNTDKGAH